MNYVFFGTPEFGAIVLDELIQANLPPSLVITNLDKPAGRKKNLTPSPVKVLAEKYKIPIFQPEKINTEECKLKIKNYTLGILAAYGKIIPKEIISLFPKGIIVIHPSLLPLYRGATPIQTAIINGDKKTGTSLILMDEKVDHGPILATKILEEPISEMTTNILSEKLAHLSGNLLVETLSRFVKNEITSKPQDHEKATYTKKLTLEDGFVDLSKDRIITIDHKIRALNEEPGCWTIIRTPLPGKTQLPLNKKIKLLEAKMSNNILTITKIQTEGKTPQPVEIKIETNT